MTALTAPRNTLRSGETPHPSQFTLPMSAATRVWTGGMICQNSAGFAAPAAVTAGFSRVIGVATKDVNNLTGAAGDRNAELSYGVYRFGNSAGVDTLADTDRFANCYVVDDNIVAKTNAGGRPIAGLVWEVDAIGVWVLVAPSFAGSSAAAVPPTIDAKQSVRLATAAALPAYTRVGNRITMDAVGAVSIDGTAVALNNRALIKNGAAGADNGIWVQTTVGAGAVAAVFDRADDADSSDEMTAGHMVHVSEGTVNADLWFFCETNDPITLNTTALTYVQLPDYSDTISADASLTVRVSTEESTRTSADTSLTTRVSTEESTRLSSDGSLTTRVSTEESTRGSSDVSLTARVSTEESTRTSADASLTTGDGSLTTSVSTEESTRSSADLSLTTRVSSEESTRASADTSLTTRLSTEESARASADTSLTTRVSTEESTGTSADLSLTTRVSTEESTRASADTSLTTRLSTEESSAALQLAQRQGNSAAYPKTTAGVQTLLVSDAVERYTVIHVRVTEAFANGDGTQPTFKIGETDADDKFAVTGRFTGAALDAEYIFGGVLTAAKALIVTAVAGTGTTETGAIRVTAVTQP